jgi:predicted phosphodiesterase
MAQWTSMKPVIGCLALVLVLGCETVDSGYYDGSDDFEINDRAASTGHTSNNLLPNGVLTLNQYLQSTDGSHRLYLQSDGNVVLRRMSDKKTLWSTGTKGTSATRFVFQSDGNLVLRTAAGTAVWSSKTAKSGATQLHLHSAGQLVLYKDSTVVWSANGSPVDNCPNDPNKTEPGECGCGNPEGSCSNAWKFVVVGDSRGGTNGVNTEAWGHLVQAIVKEGAEFVLFPGDLTTNGTLSQFQQWLKTSKPLYDAKIGVYPIRGNHDDASLSAWNTAFSGSYRLPQNGPTNEKNLTYSVTHKNVFFVGLDNYSSTYKIHQSWLSTQLAANVQPHVFVFGHEPAFAANHTDTLDDNSSQRNTFWQSLKNAGCRAYFSGHDHFYDHTRIDDGDGKPDNDLHQFIVGTAGAPLNVFDGKYNGSNSSYSPKQQYNAKQYGYVVVQIDGMKARLTFKQRSGSSYVAKDTLSYTVQ